MILSFVKLVMVFLVLPMLFNSKRTKTFWALDSMHGYHFKSFAAPLTGDNNTHINTSFSLAVVVESN
jgi:hypothetical protein